MILYQLKKVPINLEFVVKGEFRSSGQRFECEHPYPDPFPNHPLLEHTIRRARVVHKPGQVSFFGCVNVLITNGGLEYEGVFVQVWNTNLVGFQTHKIEMGYSCPVILFFSFLKLRLWNDFSAVLYNKVVPETHVLSNEVNLIVVLHNKNKDLLFNRLQKPESKSFLASIKDLECYHESMHGAANRFAEQHVEEWQ